MNEIYDYILISYCIIALMTSTLFLIDYVENNEESPKTWIYGVLFILSSCIWFGIWVVGYSWYYVMKKLYIGIKKLQNIKTSNKKG